MAKLLDITHKSNTRGKKNTSVQDISVGLLRKHASSGTLKVLWEWLNIKAKGCNGSVKKSETKHWKKMVSSGLAREGKTHIHLLPNRIFITGETVSIQGWMLAEKPSDVVYLILQAWFLRASTLKGKRKAQIIRNIRLVSNENHGGVCLEKMASFFGKTKQWASQMRRRMTDKGWCNYKRRFTKVGEDELYFANVDGDPGRYARHYGLPVKELVSACTINVVVRIGRDLAKIESASKECGSLAVERYQRMKRGGAL